MTHIEYCYFSVLLLSQFSQTVLSKGEKCYENICLQSNYDRDQKPPSHNGEPILVDMTYILDNILSVDSDLNIVGIQLSLMQTWMDTRIFLKNQSFSENNCDWISLPDSLHKISEQLPTIWIPNIWVYSMTDFKLKYALQQQSVLQMYKADESCPDTLATLKAISPSTKAGYLLKYYTQFDLFLKCNMSYEKFPFDDNTCKIQITSANYDINGVKFLMTQNASWRQYEDKPLTTSFEVAILPLDEKDNIVKSETDSRNWSASGFYLRLKRKSLEYVWNYYVTSLLCVFVLWNHYM